MPVWHFGWGGCLAQPGVITDVSVDDSGCTLNYWPDVGTFVSVNVDLGATASGGSDYVPATRRTEQQTLAFSPPVTGSNPVFGTGGSNGWNSSGTLTLTYGASTTANLVGMSASQIDAVIAAASGCGGATIVSGGPGTTCNALVIDYGVDSPVVVPTINDSLDRQNEVQTLAFNATPQNGGFVLMFNGQATNAINCSAGLPSAAAVQSALAALPNIGAGNVSVSQSGLVYTIAFQGDLGNSAQNLITTTLC